MKSFYLKHFSFFVSIFLFLFCVQSIYAASFDCKKASNEIEKMICKTPEISELDTTLGNQFNSLRKLNLPLIADQKKWLKEFRDVCRTTECLSNAYSKRISFLGKIDICSIKESDLIGNWLKVKGSSFEEINFSSLNGVNSFVSWLHHHPEMTGTWRVDKCVIFIKHSNLENLQFELRIQKIENTKLYVLDTDTDVNSIYRRN